MGDSLSGVAGAADVLRRGLGVDRVSISEVDPERGTFEILHTAGAELLVSGTRLPLGLSSHFTAAAEDRTFLVEDFAGDPGFDRPVDEVVVAAGFGSGCAVPVHRGEEVIGAIALTSREPDRSFDRALGALDGAASMFSLAIDPAPHRPLALLCHTDPLVGQGLARLVERATNARAVVCGTLEEARSIVAAEAPALIVCDDHLDGVRMDAFLPAVREAGAAAPVTIVATHDTPENRGAAVRAGVAAYLPRSEALERLPRAIFSVCAGRTMLPPAGPAGPELTERELEFLGLLEEGLRLKQIALALGIAPATAKTHARNVFRKLETSSRAEAVREARRQGLLD